MLITDEQVDFIRTDLQRRGISMSSLRDGLLDHLCCMLEADTSETDFKLAYARVISEFGEFDFLPIQEETQQLLRTIERNKMSKTLRVSGFLSCAFIIAGSSFKFMHWPGANILLLLGTFVLAGLFTPVFFMHRYKTGEVSNRNTFLAILGAAGSIMLGLGACFRFLHWPGALILMYSGIAVLLLGYVPVYMISVYRKSLNLTNAVSTVVMMVAVSGIIFTTLASGNSRKTELDHADVLSREDVLIVAQQQLNEQMFAALNDSLNANSKAVHAETKAYVAYMNGLKKHLLANAGVSDYHSVSMWSSTGFSEVLLSNEGEYNIAQINQKRDALNKLAGRSKLEQLDAEKIYRMPFGLLMLAIAQWQHDALLLDAELLMQR
jgi:hypothetical protein